MYDVVVGRSAADKKKFGTRGAVFIGKHYVHMGSTTSLSNKIYLDVTRSHVVFLCGKRGSGKSYTMGVIAEGVADLPSDVKDNIAIIMLDTMGVYWPMKYANKKEEDLLKEWDLESKGLDIMIYTPKGFFKEQLDKGIPTDRPFSIKPAELDASDWCLTFEIQISSPEGVLIETTINDLLDANKPFDLEDIKTAIKNQENIEDHVKQAVINRYTAASKWGLFDKEGTPLSELAKGGQVTVLDVSCYATAPGTQGLRALVIGLVAEKLFVERMIARKEEEIQQIKEKEHVMREKVQKKQKDPLVWLVIDECLPYGSLVETDHGPKEIGKIVADVENGKKHQVLGYDQSKDTYDFYPVSKGYKRPKRDLMAFTTETGKALSCTPDHKVFSKKGFTEAQSAKDIAIPLESPYSQKKKDIEARLLGAIFGDGWLSSNRKSVGFAGNGNNEDLIRIKHDLKELGFSSSSIHSRKTESNIQTANGKMVIVRGTSHSITTSTNAWNHFKKLGAPVGTKVLSPSKIPSWIKKGSKKTKAEFLAGLMGADGHILSPTKKVPSDFNPIRLSFNKIGSHEQEGFEFANELKKLFESVGVRISNIVKRPGNLRKDGHKTFKIQITIAKSVPNTIGYIETVGYRFCQEKEHEGQKWLAYLKYRQNIIKTREQKRKKALKLHQEKGLGKIKIGRLLDLPSHIIREWIYYKGKAGVPKKTESFQEWTSKRVNGKNLFAKIIKKEKKKQDFVYDLSVDKVHNFVADGFLAHNCHEFLPREGTTAASHPLTIILREGRQPGISLVLATQQPGKVHTDVMTQSDIVISHRLTAKMDVEALGMVMQSYMREGLDKQINNLPRLKGSAVVFDDNNERMYAMRVRPRFTWHGGEAPTAMKENKKVFDF